MRVIEIDSGNTVGSPSSSLMLFGRRTDYPREDLSEGRGIKEKTHIVKLGLVKRLIIRTDEEWLDHDPRLCEIL